MAAHVHAEKMAQFAEDAKKTENPGTLWQYSYKGRTDKWFDFDAGNSPSWSLECDYRRKPQKVTKYYRAYIGGDGKLSVYGSEFKDSVGFGGAAKWVSPVLSYEVEV